MNSIENRNVEPVRLPESYPFLPIFEYCVGYVATHKPHNSLFFLVMPLSGKCLLTPGKGTDSATVEFIIQRNARKHNIFVGLSKFACGAGPAERKRNTRTRSEQGKKLKGRQRAQPSEPTPSQGAYSSPSVSCLRRHPGERRSKTALQFEKTSSGGMKREQVHL